jgi:E3 ubiquitin-protein ligase RBBP6
MSCIHYKLITNLNYEKLTFDGVNLSVYELKKQILEKKFKRNSSSNKHFEIDLEVTNADTQESKFSCFLF